MRRRYNHEPTVDFWPGFTDALLSVVLVLIFVVSIFVITQTGLVRILGSKETALERLSRQLTLLEQDLNLSEKDRQLSEQQVLLLRGEVEGALTLLSQSRKRFSEEIEATRSRLGQTQEDLQSATSDLQQTLDNLQETRQTAEQKEQELQASAAQINALSEKISQYLRQVKLLNDQLTNTKEELRSKDASLGDLNQAVTNLNNRIAQLNAQLDEAKAEAQSRKLELTKLITEIEERDQEISRLRRLEKYRSEFLASLQDIFGGVEDIRVAGDRFVFQGEVLFDSGKADLTAEGKEKLDRFMQIYNNLESKIPKNIGFNIQIQGHTDTDPIRYAQFKSNWELSNARATAVVRYLISQGVPPAYLSSAGFGQFYPAVQGDTEVAKRMNRRIEIFFTRRQ